MHNSTCCYISSNNRIIVRTIFVSGSVRNSAEKVEGPGTQEAKESVNGSRAEVGPDVASKLSSLFAGLPSLAGPQRLATSLRQKFANNSGKFTNFPRSTAPSPRARPWRPSLRSLTKLSGVPARRPVIVINKRGCGHASNDVWRDVSLPNKSFQRK